MQKVFRWIDGDTEYAANNIRQLAPAIMAVLPLEYRHRLLPEDSFMSRLARLEKETSEAKVAVAMNAPRHQKLKELSEGIVEMFRVDPDLTAPLMAMVTSMLGVCENYRNGESRSARTEPTFWCKNDSSCRRNNGKKSTLLPYRCT